MHNSHLHKLFYTTGNDVVSLNGDNTHVTLQFAGNIAQGSNSVYGFDTLNHVIQIADTNASVSSSISGSYTQLTLTGGTSSSVTTRLSLFSVRRGSLNLQYGDNEVQLYNL